MKTLRSGTRNVIGTSTTTTTHATTSFLPSPPERGEIPLRSFCFVQEFETSSPSLALSGARNTWSARAFYELQGATREQAAEKKRGAKKRAPFRFSLIRTD
jgi:hypothetical protein